MSAKTHNKIKNLNTWIDFFYQYFLTIVLLLIVLMLLYQNFFLHQFPQILLQKGKIIEQNISLNQHIENENKEILDKIAKESESNMEMLESRARHQFGLIKSGEKYIEFRK